jgi:hypothetical protein
VGCWAYHARRIDECMLRNAFDSDQWSAPIVIGGTGGSGTRLIARLLREMGVDLGTRVNGAEDALSFVPLYDKYVNAYLESGAVDTARLETDLLAAIHSHVDPAGKPAWGWKNPRSIFLLPVLDNLIPGFRFVHVVRHGLDMATSANQNQVLLHSRAALGSEHDSLPVEARSALLWMRINGAAADYGQRMPGRYFLLRYEDVCANPQGSLAPLAAAFGLVIPSGGWREPVAPVAPRWVSLDPVKLADLRARIGDALARFGYPC